jgi:PhzF family phenazine biosynthesis protein
MDALALDVQRIAAFSDGDAGGNPAGVVLCDALPPAGQMQRVAAEVGFSETAFVAKSDGGWRVRYFSPAAEVPFCGHATLALGAALAWRHGDGRFPLELSRATITVEARRAGALMNATLESPPTRSAPAPQDVVDPALELFGYTRADLDPRFVPANIHGGADHLLLMLNSRAALAAMRYDFDAGRALMQREGWVTVLLGWAESGKRFHTRNAFAYGGVLEDPATGAATAAFAGRLVDIGWPDAGPIEVVQGEDMGSRSLLRAELPARSGDPVRVSGSVRRM